MLLAIFETRGKNESVPDFFRYYKTLNNFLLLEEYDDTRMPNFLNK
jgi:hypothetical protein